MTTAQNPVSVVEPNQYPQWVPVTSDLTINEGDLVYWDGTNFSATPLTANTDVASKFMGVALGSSQSLVYPGDNPYPGVPVLAKATVFLNTTAGETYNPFDDVTVGADSQTITKTGATTGNRVGFVVIDPPSSARPHQATPVPESVAGGAGVRVRVVLEPKHKVGAAL